MLSFVVVGQGRQLEVRAQDFYVSNILYVVYCRLQNSNFGKVFLGVTLKVLLLKD